MGECVGELVGERVVGAGVGVPLTLHTCKKAGTSESVLLMQFLKIPPNLDTKH